jgi:predicted transglutaminase-like cysteine proteinase
VIFPVTIMGVAVMCAAGLSMCLSSLAMLSSVLRSGDAHFAAYRTLNMQLLLKGDLRLDTTTSVASIPDLLRRDIHLIRFDTPTLPPMAFTQFCLTYADECQPQRRVFRGGRLKLTDERWAELDDVNRIVNASIRPERNTEGLAGEKWLLGPALGDCNDYAVTKRHKLIARGWPASVVLLSEVVTVSGEHHLVAVVRTNEGDFVLDNLTDRILPWSDKPFQWVRIQTPKNPNYWASVSGPNA